MTFERVGVVGAGLMGSGIAEVSARSGASVTVVEANDDAAAAGRARIEKSLDRAVRGGKLEEAEQVAILDRLTFSDDLGAMADRELVVEAIVEDEAAKTNATA